MAYCAEKCSRDTRENSPRLYGESTPLAAEEQSHIPASRLPTPGTDHSRVDAAFVYDTAAGAEPTVQLIEYANTQLLEFRFYDESLLASLEKSTGCSTRAPAFGGGGGYRARPSD
jgi:hypothetical protein